MVFSVLASFGHFDGQSASDVDRAFFAAGTAYTSQKWSMARCRDNLLRAFRESGRRRTRKSFVTWLVAWGKRARLQHSTDRHWSARTAFVDEYAKITAQLLPTSRLYFLLALPDDDPMEYTAADRKVVFFTAARNAVQLACGAGTRIQYQLRNLLRSLQPCDDSSVVSTGIARRTEKRRKVDFSGKSDQELEPEPESDPEPEPEPESDPEPEPEPESDPEPEPETEPVRRSSRLRTATRTAAAAVVALASHLARCSDDGSDDSNGGDGDVGPGDGDGDDRADVPVRRGSDAAAFLRSTVPHVVASPPRLLELCRRVANVPRLCADFYCHTVLHQAHRAHFALDECFREVRTDTLWVCLLASL
jgi:hypothetical protein